MNPKEISHTSRGVQRHQCKTCGKTFTDTQDTIYYRKHAQEAEILLEVLALLAEGTRVGTLARVKRIKDDTISRRLREATQHAHLDGLCSVTVNKGEKSIRKPIKWHFLDFRCT